MYDDSLNHEFTVIQNFCKEYLRINNNNNKLFITLCNLIEPLDSDFYCAYFEQIRLIQ